MNNGPELAAYEEADQASRASRHMLALWRVLVELAAYLPVIAVAQLLAPDSSLFATLAWLYGASLAGYTLGWFKLRIYMEWLLSLAAGAGIAALLDRGVLASLAMFIMTSVMVSRWIRIRKGDWNLLFPPSVQLVGAGCYLIYPLLAKAWEPLQQWNGLMYGGAVLLLVVFFYRLNQHQLTRANLSRTSQHGVPRIVARVNQTAVAVLIALLLLAANIKQIQAWLLALWAKLAAWLSAIFSREPVAEEPRSELPQQPSMDNMFPAEPKEKSAFWAMLEQIFMIVATTLITAGIVVGIAYLFVKIVVPALRRWLLDLNQERQEQGEFVDEMEKLDGDDWRKRMKLAMARLRLRQEQEPADAEGRVRYRYKLMLQEAARDGYAYADSDTPVEASAKLGAMGWHKRPFEAVTALYNRVRYGGSRVSASEAEELDRLWGKKKER